MTVKIAVPAETGAHEKRVAMVPAVVPRVAKLGTALRVQQGAGNPSRIDDTLYQEVELAADAAATVDGAQIVLRVAISSPEEVQALPEGCVLFSFVYPTRQPEIVEALKARKITCFAMELVPRTTRAQAMDALSSQAALAGYYGALLGATKLSRLLPMVMLLVSLSLTATMMLKKKLNMQE